MTNNKRSFTYYCDVCQKTLNNLENTKKAHLERCFLQMLQQENAEELARCGEAPFRLEVEQALSAASSSQAFDEDGGQNVKDIIKKHNII